MSNGSFSLYEDFIKVFENWSIYSAVGIAFAFSVWKFVKKNKKRDYQVEFTSIHSEIHELLTELRLVTDSARTQVIQLHNGEYFMDGVSMRKFSVTHESLERGIDSCATRMHAVLCSLFIPLLTLVLENSAKIQYVTDLKDSYFKQFFESRNIEAFSVLPLKVKNQITGFLLVQWCNSKKIDDIEPVFVSHQVEKIRNAIQVQLLSQPK
jgi:transcriptional regulator with GAF, ATPase, and Fis domain